MRLFSTLFIVLLAIAAGAAVYMWSGTYNVAANVPHWGITHKVLEYARERSIEVHSKDIKVPPLKDPALLKKGLNEFDETCRLCHGAPEIPREHYAMGMYPSPPDLTSEELQKELNDAALFWIIKNGLKMTGMPAFDMHDDDELWGTVAFIRELPKLTPEKYKQITSGRSSHEHGQGEGHRHEESTQGHGSHQ